MRVFVTGASGWIGAALLPELIDAGHEVFALARSQASADAIRAVGGQPVSGDLGDLAVLRRAGEESDAVVHLAFGHDFTQFAAAVAADRAAIDALGTALAGSGKALVIASGTPAIPGRVSTEDDFPAGAGPIAARAANAQAVLALADKGVRSAVVRLPRSVHGRGEQHGFLRRLIQDARDNGRAGYVGDGTARWPAVHVKDAANLFRLAIESAPGGCVLHAVADEGVPVAEITGVIARHLDVPSASVPAEHFGFLGAVFGTDQPSSSARTRERLGWEPSHPNLLTDLDAGHYFE